MKAHPLIFEDITLKYATKTVFENFSLTFPAGKCSVIMGQSGSGKTSLLRLAAGLTDPKYYTGKVHTGTAKVAYQFQEPRLFPWLTVCENIAVVLEDADTPLHSPALRKISIELLDALSLGNICDDYTNTLSGGMAQRVALARTLAARGELILLDEPFRGLDIDTKKAVMNTVKERMYGATVVLVTHDIQEANFFADGEIISV